MPMRFITRPLHSWTRPQTKDRKRSPYSVGFDRTLRDLGRELLKLGVDGDVVIQVDLEEKRIRQDGMPYADVSPRTPRVLLSFTSEKHGAMTYSCDRFTDWTSNVRAIALGLERLRLVEETGIISRGEQYTGFKALPAGIPLPPPPMTVDEAATVIFEISPGFSASTIIASVVAFNASYRHAAKACHPDRGGDPEKWKKLQAAAEVLEKHHGVKP